MLPAPIQGRAVPPSQPLFGVRPGPHGQNLTMGPLTRGRAAVASSSQGEEPRRSTSPGVRHVGGVEPKPAPT